jgi:phage terminase large subunit-like protein
LLTSLLGSPLLGAETPRVELRQPAAYSLGGPAAELAKRAGLTLEPWQVDGLELMLSVRRDGRWACFEYGEMCPRQNGKTAMFAARALAGLLLFDERLIMWSAHEVKTALEGFLLMRDLLSNLGETAGPRDNLIDIGGVLVKVNATNGEESFERLDTKQRLKFVARSKGSGRGFSGDVNLIDEAFAYTPGQQSALMPTMTARPNPQICYASTPPLDSESGEVLFALQRRAENREAGLGWRDWGAAGDLEQLMQMEQDDRDEFLDDRARWCETNPAVGRGRVDEESILRNRRGMREEDFARECYGMWPLPPEQGGRVVREAEWDRLADPESTFEGTPVFAIDCAPQGKWAAIAAAGRREDGVPHVEVIEHLPGTGWVVARARELHEKYEPGAWLLDPGGPAGALVVELEGAGIPLQFVAGREYASACGAFLAAVTDSTRDGLRHLGDPVLAAAVAAGRKRDIGDGGWAWGRKNSEVNISPLVAVTLAHHIAAANADPLDNIW